MSGVMGILMARGTSFLVAVYLSTAMGPAAAKRPGSCLLTSLMLLSSLGLQTQLPWPVVQDHRQPFCCFRVLPPLCTPVHLPLNVQTVEFSGILVWWAKATLSDYVSLVMDWRGTINEAFHTTMMLTLLTLEAFWRCSVTSNSLQPQGP